MQSVRSTLRRRSYTKAPVSPLYLFDRQQDFAYQQEVAGNPPKRHHVRFWRAPEGWMLPGGYPVDWLAAGTYDRSVGLSLFTLQITHKIEANTDLERDYITNTITGGNVEVVVGPPWPSSVRRTALAWQPPSQSRRCAPNPGWFTAVSSRSSEVDYSLGMGSL